MESGDYDEIAVSRQPPNGQFKCADLMLFPGSEITRSHGQFIEVGKEGVQ